MQTTHSPENMILNEWEQALEDAESVSLGKDPYDLIGMAKEANTQNNTYITIPVSQATLSRLYEKAQKQNKTTTKYLEEIVEYA